MANGNGMIFNGKYKAAVWIVERIGLPTALVGVGLWMVTTFWLSPELESKAESRRVLASLISAQQTAIGIQGESLKGQIRLLEVNTQQTAATKEALVVLTNIVQELSSRQIKTDSLVMTNQELIVALSEQIKQLAQIQKTTMDLMTEASDTMAPLPEMRQKQLELLQGILDALKKPEATVNP